MDLLRPTRSLIAAVLLFAVTGTAARGSALPVDGPREYAVKSVFLYNFCRFIEWPRDAFSGPNEPIVIGVVGEDPFGPMLEEAVSGETMRGRSIRIERYRKAADIRNCHLLFVSRSETPRISEIIAAVAGRSVVTVGESDLFLDRGGMIALTTDQNRVRLRINPAPLRAASLNVSSKLLRVAEIKS